MSILPTSELVRDPILINYHNACQEVHEHTTRKVSAFLIEIRHTLEQGAMFVQEVRQYGGDLQSRTSLLPPTPEILKAKRIEFLQRYEALLGTLDKVKIVSQRIVCASIEPTPLSETLHLHSILSGQENPINGRHGAYLTELVDLNSQLICLQNRLDEMLNGADTKGWIGRFLDIVAQDGVPLGLAYRVLTGAIGYSTIPKSTDFEAVDPGKTPEEKNSFRSERPPASLLVAPEPASIPVFLLNRQLISPQSPSSCEMERPGPLAPESISSDSTLRPAIARKPNTKGAGKRPELKVSLPAA